MIIVFLFRYKNISIISIKTIFLIELIYIPINEKNPESITYWKSYKQRNK